VPRWRAVDGFSLTYYRSGSGSPIVLLLHGWPGTRADFRAWCRYASWTVLMCSPSTRKSGHVDRHPRRFELVGDRRITERLLADRAADLAREHAGLDARHAQRRIGR
jgi:hypothetical protein